jgi:hypothetical protein
LATALSEINLGKLSLFVAMLSCERHDSRNFHKFVTQPDGQSKFLIKFCILLLKPGELKADAWAKLAPVPRDFGHYPAGLLPAFRLVLQIHHFYLNPTLGWTAYRSIQVRFSEAHQDRIAWQPDEIGATVFLAIFVDLWVGKGGITPKPEQLEPAPVALHYRLDELQNAIG